MVTVMAGRRVFVFLLCSLAVVLLASEVAVAQQFDESGKFCRSKKKQCPDDPSKPYEKYCCIENYGGLAYPVCCSPYFGVEIGAGIGIPVVLLLIVAIVGGYCCCLKMQQRRMAAFQELRDDDSEGAGDVGTTHLQQYSSAGEDKPPAYSSDDPYPNPPEYTAEAGDSHIGDQAPHISTSEGTGDDPDPASTEDIPLSVGSDTSDTTPLVDRDQSTP